MFERSRTTRRLRWWEWPLLVPLVIFAIALVIALSPLILTILATRAVVTGVLLLIVWTKWLPRGKRALVIYSNSPIWQSYFEEKIVSPLAPQAVVLNWSERKQWKRSLAVMLFRWLAPYREFNPMVMVFRPYRRTLRFKFYEAFRAYKHGKPRDVETTRAKLFEALGVVETRDTAA
jgi:hypothetical protein